MYALSRPFAVDSHTSSPGAKRTSTGNAMLQPDRSSQVEISRNVSLTVSTGTAYSISRKRTRRGDANTW